MKGAASVWVASGLWAMTEDAYRGVQALVDRVEITPDMVKALHGPEAVSMKAGVPLPDAPGVENRDGVAIIQVHGVLSRYSSLMTEYSGGCSVESIARDFAASLADPRVKSILFDVNSPGGNVDGIGELANAIHDARGVKPLCCYVGNQAASAGYWIGSACDRVVVNAAAEVGSIGVIYTCDVSSNPKHMQITSSQSPDKRLDPRNEDGRSKIQARCDEMADIFIGDVARFRGVKPARVIRDFGCGDTKLGNSAVADGMADAIGSFESTLSTLSQGKLPKKTPVAKPTGKARGAHQRGPSMDVLSRLKLFLALTGPKATDMTEASEDNTDDATDVYLKSLAIPQEPPRVRYQSATLAPAFDAKEIEAKIEARIRGEFEAKILGEFEASTRKAAEAWLIKATAASKVLPHEGNVLKAMFVDFALADRAGLVSAMGPDGIAKTYSRLDHFKAEIDARKANLTGKELIGNDEAEAVAKLAKRGQTVLAGSNDDATQSTAYVARLTAHMPPGLTKVAK